MLTKTLTTALVTGLLLTGAMQSQSFANGGGGDGAGFDWATMHNPDGSTVTSRANRDRSHTITHRDHTGKITKQERRAARKAAKKGKMKIVRRKSRPWASAYDPATRTRTTAVGNGDGSRTVFTFSPFGFSIGFSR